MELAQVSANDIGEQSHRDRCRDLYKSSMAEHLLPYLLPLPTSNLLLDLLQTSSLRLRSSFASIPESQTSLPPRRCRRRCSSMASQYVAALGLRD